MSFRLFLPVLQTFSIDNREEERFLTPLRSSTKAKQNYIKKFKFKEVYS